MKKIIILYWIMFFFTCIRGLFASEIEFIPAIGNLENSSTGSEIVTVSFGGRLFVWNNKGGILNSNFPISLEDEVFSSSPALGDIDNDSEDEIVIISRDASSKYYLKIYDKIYDKDASEIQSISLEGANFSDPVVIKSDTEIEIALTTENNYLKIYKKSETGFSLSQSIGIFGKAVLASGNIDADVEKELIVGYHDTPKIDIFNKIAGIWGGSNSWSISAVLQSGINTVDIDSDGVVDKIAFVSQGNKVYLLDKNGSNLSGWPKEIQSFSRFTPQFVDIINQDNNPEVVLLLHNGKTQAWDLSGKPVDSKLTKNLRFPFDSAFSGKDAMLIQSFLGSQIILNSFGPNEEEELGIFYHPMLAFAESLTPQETEVMARHIIQLRWAINYLREKVSLKSISWTDDLKVGETEAMVKHINELRIAISEVYDKLGLSISFNETLQPGSDTDPESGTWIQADHIKELRDKVKEIW